MKVNQWTLGMAAAGIIAFAAVCSIAGKSDPPAQMADVQASQTEIIAQTDTPLENISPPEVVVATQTDAAGMIAKFDSSALDGKEVAFTGTQLAAGVISFVAGLDHTATVAHEHPRVLAIPVAAIGV